MTVSADMMDRTMESDLIPMAASPLPQARRVLVFAPHADDEVFGCGATLHLLAGAGASIAVVVASDGALGGKRDGAAGTTHAPTLTEQREAESRAAAQVLGYPAPIFWRLPDRGVRYGEALVARMIEAMQAQQSDLVFAPALTELHPDHQALALAAAEALRRLGGERRIAFYEVGAPLLPNTLIDITASETPKRAAMRCFRSQLAEHPYDERIAALNRYRAYTLGAQVGAAEAFFIVSAADLGAGLTPLFESALGRRRRLGVAVDGADLPLVSVIVRSMDRPTLAQALASVAAQTYPNIEAVVVNAKGGRHSPLPDLGGRLATQLLDTGVPLERGQAANAGLTAATGRYLLVLDDHNLLLPDHIAKLVASLRGGRTRAAFSGVRLVDGDGRDLRTYDGKDCGPAGLFDTDFVPIHALLFDSALLKEECRFDEQSQLDPRSGYLADRGFWQQIARQTPVEHVPGVSAVHRYAMGEALHGQTRQHGPTLENAAAAAETSAGAGAAKQALLAELGANQSELRSARFEMAATKSELEAVQIHARSLQLGLERVTCELDSIVNSRSWKLTAAPRRLVQSLRRLKARLG